MKVIRSQTDIKVLKEVGVPKNVVDHVTQYFKHILEVYGADCNAQESESTIVLLEEGDPLSDPTFLEEKLEIRGGRTLLTVIKEFVDYHEPSNQFEVYVLLNDDEGLTYLIPNEPWIGKELLDQLQTFENYQENSSEQ